MKKFNPDYVLLKEMYQDEYYPDFLVDKVKTEITKVIELLESGESDVEIIQGKLDEITWLFTLELGVGSSVGCFINSL